MRLPPLVPPIKCQGIKTKLVGEIKNLLIDVSWDRWVEPFCGSGVVAFNINSPKALFCDSNIHIIQFYNDIKKQHITPKITREFLQENGTVLSEEGEEYYYKVRKRFNQSPNSLDFLFLNRSCFNGVMRFNRKGQFNVPFCHKKDRFSKSYITKIVNQISAVKEIISNSDYTFQVEDFRDTLSCLQETDLVYVDPPYAGRHVDYFNTWSERDEECLVTMLKNLSCKFILSTWHSNQFRTNPLIEKNWLSGKFYIYTRQHFYHVGSTEKLRHPMTEAIITNFQVSFAKEQEANLIKQLSLFSDGVTT